MSRPSPLSDRHPDRVQKCIAEPSRPANTPALGRADRTLCRFRRYTKARRASCRSRSWRSTEGRPRSRIQAAPPMARRAGSGRLLPQLGGGKTWSIVTDPMAAIHTALPKAVRPLPTIPRKPAPVAHHHLRSSVEQRSFQTQQKTARSTVKSPPL